MLERTRPWSRSKLVFAVDTSASLFRPPTSPRLARSTFRGEAATLLFARNHKLAVRETIPNEISYGFAEFLARDEYG